MFLFSIGHQTNVGRQYQKNDLCILFFQVGSFSGSKVSDLLLCLAEKRHLYGDLLLCLQVFAHSEDDEFDHDDNGAVNMPSKMLH